MPPKKGKRSRDPRRSSFFDSPEAVKPRSKSGKRKARNTEVNTTDGFSYRKRGKQSTKPVAKKQKTPAKAKMGGDAKETPALPSLPASSFQPKKYPDEMSEPAKFQKLMEDMDLHFLNNIKETFQGEHSYIVKAVSDTIDEYLNNSRVSTEREIKALKKSQRSKMEEDIQKWREIKEKWSKIEEEPLPGLDNNEKESEDDDDSKSLKETFQHINVKGDEILNSLRATLQLLTKSHKAHSKIASLLNHKAFGIYADSDAPKTLLRQFMS